MKALRIEAALRQQAKVMVLYSFDGGGGGGGGLNRIITL